MPAEEAQATTEQQPAAPPTPAAPSAERGQALIQKHVAATEAAMRAERDEEATPSAEEAEKPATPQRGKDGKFVAGERGSTSPHKAGAPGATPGPATEEDKPKEEPAKTEPAPAGSIGKAQRLVREGKIADALQLIGLDPEKLPGDKWAAWRHQNKAVASEITAAREGVQRERAELQQVAQQVYRDVGPLIEAKKAIASQDYDKAIQLMFGQTWDDFQKARIRELANPGMGKDPTVLALQKRIDDYERREAERQRLEQEQRTQAQVQERQRAYWNQLTQDLKSSEDPRIAKAAERQLFVQEVFEIQKKHYDPRTDSTLPANEAAELAFEKLYGEYSEWNEIFGGDKPSEPRDRGAKNHAATGPGGTPVRRTAKSTSLNPSEAAEAAPPVKLKGKALMDYYVRKTEESIRNAG